MVVLHSTINTTKIFFSQIKICSQIIQLLVRSYWLSHRSGKRAIILDFELAVESASYTSTASNVNKSTYIIRPGLHVLTFRSMHLHPHAHPHTCARVGCFHVPMKMLYLFSLIRHNSVVHIQCPETFRMIRQPASVRICKKRTLSNLTQECRMRMRTGRGNMELST